MAQKISAPQGTLLTPRSPATRPAQLCRIEQATISPGFDPSRLPTPECWR